MASASIDSFMFRLRELVLSTIFVSPEDWGHLLGILSPFLVVLWIVNGVWAYKDAKKRGKSGFLIGFFVFLTVPWGAIAWLIFRPKNAFDLDEDPSPPEQYIEPISENIPDPDRDLKQRANDGLL